MKPTAAAIILLSVLTPASAEWLVIDRGDWPETWPAELDPLREQSRTLEGGLIELVVYEIPFTSRKQFEAAWPHILDVKTAGAPLILVRGSGDRFFGRFDAGVVIHTPPKNGPQQPAEPLPGREDVRRRWMYTTFIELVVDGDVVDLNRIRLPADSPIVDERFAEGTAVPEVRE